MSKGYSYKKKYVTHWKDHKIDSLLKQHTHTHKLTIFKLLYKKKLRAFLVHGGKSLCTLRFNNLFTLSNLHKMFLVIAGQRRKDQREFFTAPLYKIVTINLYLVRNAQLHEIKKMHIFIIYTLSCCVKPSPISRQFIHILWGG